ncbi:MAG: tetratricopeptide repeat protein, partial [Thermoanaerobaculia bacterium]
SNGQPVAGATVTISLSSGSTQPIVTKTDSKGRWSALGLTSGQWNVDIVAPGYEPSRGSVALSQGQMVPPIRAELVPEVKQEVAAASVQTSPKVPKEAVDAVNNGQELMKAEKYKEAVAEFEKALPLIPTDTPDLQTAHTQIQQILAQAYYKSGDIKKAISIMEALNQSDPFTTPDAGQLGRSLLLANLYLENGQLDQGKALLDKLPGGSVTDPNVYINVGILFMNKKNPTEASSYFTKAIGLDPKLAESYYYRGLAEAQLKKIAEARADFQQVIALSPDSPEARDSKQMLDSLPKK